MDELITVDEARHVGGHVLWLRLSDGTEGTADLSEALEGEVFVPLRDVQYFSRFSLDSELGTVIWPNGADFAPEFLRDLVLASAAT